MVNNYDFPWYLQESPVFLALYNGFFRVAEDASPLGIGDAFNIDAMEGVMLYRLGTYWGMSGSPYIWDGLIYNVDPWSDVKTWTGGLKELGQELYSNLIKAKAYAYGRPYSLLTIKGALERLFTGQTYQAEVVEDDMEITISLTAARSLLEIFIEAKAFDLVFIGKPAGIKVTWEYNFV